MQNFTLELHSSSSSGRRRLVANVTNQSRPTFVARGLRPDAAFSATVFAANAKGRGEPAIMHIYTSSSGSSSAGAEDEIMVGVEI